MLITIVGLLAAALTYIPQVKKALPAGSTDDLSSKTLAVLATGARLMDRLWHPQGQFRDHRRKCRRICLGRHADRTQDPGHTLEPFEGGGTHDDLVLIESKCSRSLSLYFFRQRRAILSVMTSKTMMSS